MPKRFTLAEAQSLIPRLTGLLREAITAKSEYAEAEGVIRANATRVMMMGGTQVDRAASLEAKARIESTGVRLKTAIEAIEKLGCVVKDLDTGLVDFPAMRRGTEVYLCWRLGEPEIRFWHNLDEGFAGRKALGGDFGNPGGQFRQ